MQSPLKDKFLQRAFFVWGDTNSNLPSTPIQNWIIQNRRRSREQFKIQNSKFKIQKRLLLPSNSCPFALQKDSFCSPKGLVLQPKRTPFQNDRTFNFRKRRFSEMVMLVPFYPVSLHHQKKTNNKQRRIKRKRKKNQTENKDELKQQTKMKRRTEPMLYEA